MPNLPLKNLFYDDCESSISAVTMLKITQSHIETMQKIRNQFLAQTKVPPAGRWKTMDRNGIWFKLVSQVMVVQGSRAAEKLDADAGLKAQLAYDELVFLADAELKKRIVKVLSATGTRFVNKKADAIFYNFHILRDSIGGPEKLIAVLSSFGGLNSDRQRVLYVVKQFKFIKSKGARDLLMGLGLLTDVIAFDSRVKKILIKVGISLPPKFEIKESTYSEIESEILEKICKPLQLTGVQFDRLIYQNGDKILQFLDRG